MIRLRSLLNLVAFGRRSRTGPSRPRSTCRPALEALEARETPSSLAHTTDTTGYLAGFGGKGGDGFLGYVPVYKGNGNHVTYVYVDVSDNLI